MRTHMKSRSCLLALALQLTLSSGAQATITPGYARGEALIWHEVPSRAAEACVLPKHLPGAKYSEKDSKAEKDFCALNIGENVAACQKTNSTNPGLLFVEPPDGVSPAKFAARDCRGGDADIEAKYKLSTSCSYTPYILAHYRASRALGNAANVPVAVLRTVDLQRHQKNRHPCSPDPPTRPTHLQNMGEPPQPSERRKILPQGGFSFYR